MRWESMQTTLQQPKLRMLPPYRALVVCVRTPTKIVKGAIKICNDQKVLRKGEMVSASIVALFNKLEIKPFEYRLVPRAHASLGRRNDVT